MFIFLSRGGGIKKIKVLQK